MKRSTFVNWGSSFATLAQRFGPQAAVCTETGEHSFAEVLGRAAALAKTLAEIGVQPGEPVATFLPNQAHAVWASIGVTLSGAAETSLNFGLTAEELKYSLDLLKIRHVISDERLAPVVRGCGYSPLSIESLGQELATLDTQKPVEGNLWGKILFTSGTTGKPKAIIHSHERRWTANLMLRSSLPFMPDLSSRILLVTPYSHGSSLLAGAFLDSGASVYLMEGAKTDVIKELLSSGDVDCIFAPPTVLAKLIASLGHFRCDTLRAVFTGTATLSSSLYRQTREVFGPVVRITYGKTEIFNPITVLGPHDADRAYASESGEGANLGWPVSGVEIQIRDENGMPCQQGTAGRIFIRAPHMLVGYIDHRGLHEVADGDWHESGDVGFVSKKNQLFLIGRENDVIKTGGYKVFPQEIEAPLVSARIASEIVALGVPSQYWGQFIIVAAENPVPGWDIRAKEAVACLSKYKRPRAYVALTKFPRNPQGKLQRNKVLEKILEHYQVEDGPRPGLRPEK